MLKGKIDKHDQRYVISCVKCGTRHDLMMIPHRNTSGWMVGWVFVCSDCEGKVVGSVIQIDIKE